MRLSRVHFLQLGVSGGILLPMMNLMPASGAPLNQPALVALDLKSILNDGLALFDQKFSSTNTGKTIQEFLNVLNGSLPKTVTAKDNTLAKKGYTDISSQAVRTNPTSQNTSVNHVYYAALNPDTQDFTTPFLLQTQCGCESIGDMHGLHVTGLAAAAKALSNQASTPWSADDLKSMFMPKKITSKTLANPVIFDSAQGKAAVLWTPAGQDDNGKSLSKFNIQVERPDTQVNLFNGQYLVSHLPVQTAV